MFELVNRNKIYVKNLQKEIGVASDGVFGKNSLAAAEKYFGGPVIAHMGEIVPIPGASYVVDHKDSLFQLPDGTKNWRMRKGKADTICAHWGGLNVKHCYMIFYNTKSRHVSSHFGIGYDPNEKRFEVSQWLDTGLVSYHAGKFNGYSIGLDICQSPVEKHIAKTRVFHPSAEMVPNPSSRGPRQVVSLCPEIADITNEFINDLRMIMDLEEKPMLDSDEVLGIKEATNYSVVGHHNLSKQKYDVAPWLGDLWGKESSC
jgi:hypothetical protein